jgi:type II secretory pathway component PulF
MALDLGAADSAAANPATASAPTVKPASWLTLSSQAVKPADRILFTERLALMLETGVPLHGALRSLYEQSANPRMKTIVGALADDIIGGMPFSHALAPTRLM